MTAHPVSTLAKGLSETEANILGQIFYRANAFDSRCIEADRKLRAMTGLANELVALSPEDDLELALTAFEDQVTSFCAGAAFRLEVTGFESRRPYAGLAFDAAFTRVRSAFEFGAVPRESRGLSSSAFASAP